jgi:F-type H+-transporting ATPase subunit b
MLELNRTILFQILNFLVLMGLLYLFLFKPIKRFLAQRSESIQKAYEDSESSKAEAQRKLSEYTDLLHQAEHRIEEMREAAKREVLTERNRVIQGAKEEARRLIEEGKEQIDWAVTDAREQLRKEVVNLTTTLAEKVIKRSLKQEDHRRLIQDGIESLKEKD